MKLFLEQRWLIASLMMLSSPVFAFENPVHDAWNPATSLVHAGDSSTDANAPDEYHGYDVSNYDLRMNFNPVTSEVSGTNQIYFKTSLDHLGILILDAVDMDIKRVTWGDGSELLYTYNQKQLKVTLPYPLALGFTGKVTVDFSSKRPQVLHVASADPSRADRASTAYTFTEPDGSRNWFPCHDIPSDKSITTMSFSVPDKFVVASNGDEYDMGRGTDGRRHFRFHTGVNIATYLTSVVLGPIQSEQIGMLRNIPLLISAPSYLMPAMRKETSRTKQMMRVFEHFTQTRYGFQKYRQTVAEGYQGSMEHQSVTTMGGNRITGDMSGEGVVAHELAHQWFGDLVTCGVWGDMWLNEGFASYLPKVFFAAMGEQDAWLFDMLGNRGSYFGSTNANNARAISTPEEWPSYNIFDQHSYAKASMVIHLFRQVANSMAGTNGRIEAFSRALGIYLREHAYGNGRYYDLQSALERATGASWDLLFKQWILSKGHPIVRVGWTYDDTQKEVNFDLEQTQIDSLKWGLFSFPLAFKTWDDKGNISTQWQWIDKAKQTVRFKSRNKIIAAIVDPDLIVPGTFTIAQTPAAYATAYASANPAAHYAQIIDTMMRSHENDADIAPAIASMIERSSHPLALTVIAMRIAKRDGLVNEGKLLAAKLKTVGLTNSERAQVAPLESWLVRVAKPEDRPTFASLKTKWQQAVRVEEREQLIAAMLTVDVKATQTFALAELAKPEWTDRDRAALTNAIASETTEISQPFISGMLKSVNTTSLGSGFMQTLIARQYNGTPDTLALLVNAATTHQSSSMRGTYVRLIALQKLEKSELCNALKTIKDKNRTGGVLSDISVVIPAATDAETKLGCATN